MRKIIMVAVMIAIILLLIIIFFLSKTSTTGKTIQEETENFYYSYTTAVCNSSNFCQDYTIICNGNKILNVSPITGASVQFPEDWKDLRDKKEINNLCRQH